MFELEQIAANPSILDPRVIKSINDEDQMFTGNSEHYFGCGRQAVGRIASLLSSNGIPTPTRILDFACGYGRVNRYLRAAFPDAEIGLSDLMKPGVEFCVNEFGGTALAASSEPSALRFPGAFSLIWSGSLITHLNERKARDVLRLFERSLASGGMAVFTTHGRFVANKATAESYPYSADRQQMEGLAAAFWQGHYGYTDYKHMTGYGLSTTPFSWIMNELLDMPDMRVAGFIEMGWDNHQDIVALIKKPV